MKKSILLLIVFVFAFSLQSCVVHTKPVHNNYQVTKVVYIKHAPKYYKIVAIKGKRYYFWNGKYHRKTRNGYIIVKV
ncbi:MAG: hypothetical protein L3J14_01170 [Flavobacteriaceae bacterium]|nr:hypothetical protein [Flavobacteriaceae bacterium]